MKLILCGGGAGEQNTLANQKLNEIIDNSKPILYVPLAMDEEEHPYDGCYEWIKGELSKVDIPYIDMVRTFDELASKEYEKYSAIFIGGGNTYKLLKGIKESGAFEKIKKYLLNDDVIIGSSAGTVIFGEDIDIIESMDPNDVKLEDTKGFDILSGISIFPHYTNKKSRLTEEENSIRMKKFTDSITKFSINKKVIAIPEEDAIYYDGVNMEIIGTLPYYIFEQGKIEKFNIENKIKKYVKVMDGLRSNAGGFEYKLNEVNIATNWNPNELEPEKMGGFNFGVEDKILRWLHRGDTIYDVTIPSDAEVIECQSPNCPNGVFRSNKIIVSNPRKITDEMIIDLYKKSTLPDRTYYQSLVVLLYRYHVEAAKYIIKDRINENNIDECIEVFEDMAIDRRNNKEEFSYDDLWEEAKEIYNILLNIKNIRRK